MNRCRNDADADITIIFRMMKNKPFFERLQDMAIFEPDRWVFMKHYD